MPHRPLTIDHAPAPQLRALLIRQGLMLARVSQTAIAKAVGVRKASVSNVIAGRRRSQDIEAAIAHAMRVPVSRLWPRERRAARATR